MSTDPDNRGIEFGSNVVENWTMYIWPYLEAANVALAYNWTSGFRGPNYNTVNAAVFKMKMPFYECPSDQVGVMVGEGRTDGFTRSSYVCALSPAGSIMEKGLSNFDLACNDANNPCSPSGPTPCLKRALFNWNVYRGFRDIKDGTSRTVAFSEVISGPDGTTDTRGVWWSDLGTGYSHLRTPNSAIPDQLLGGLTYCSALKAPCLPTAPCWSGLINAARSMHPGGVNACLADGSVHFFSDEIDAELWIDLASIDSGEIILVP